MSDQEEILGVGSRVRHSAFGDGVVIKVDVIAYQVCFMQYGIKNVGKEYSNWEIIDKIPFEEEVSFTGAEQSLIKILRHWSGITEEVKLADRWKNGKMILEPDDSGLKSKEVPIETFFHKLVMVRERLRVMEQKINNSKLSDEEKINLQQYITRIYGSLTTFNVLFKYKENQFVGDRSSK